jgi:hypothetical protein
MPINWDVFKNNLLSYFDGNRNSESKNSPNANDVATKIADEYELAVQQGGDLNYNNPVVTYNKPGLQLSLFNAFTQGLSAPNRSVIPTIFGSALSIGVIQFWTSGQLGLLIPPPGSTTVVTNIVNNPGVPEQIFNFDNTESNEVFIDNLIDYFTKHLETLQGLTTAIVPTTPPAPAPFPWTGYG